MATYSETLNFLYSQLPMFQRIGPAAFKKDLGNIIQLCNALGNPQQTFKSIHIAGTNGKGSVTHFMGSVLQEMGYKVGLYTSPHYKDFRERIKINGNYIDENAVINFVENHKELIQQIKPSFFEITVAMAFAYFAEQKVDYAVIETGMGGRFDSTNILLPELSIITSIDFDHQQFLGDTLAKIAFEKAGIIKKNTPCVTGIIGKEAMDVIEKRCKEENTALHKSDSACEWIKKSADLYVQGNIQVEDEIFKIKTHLIGDYQYENIATSLLSLRLLFKDKNVINNLIQKAFDHLYANTKFMGRWQKLGEKPLIFAESAHNKQGILAMVKQLEKFKYGKLHIIYGTVADKEIEEVFPLMPKNANYYLTEANIPRAMKAEVLYDKVLKIGDYQGAAFSKPQAALEAAKLQATENDLILITGSIFLVAEYL